MAPDMPSLSKRKLLGGLVGIAVGGTVTASATKPTVLPDSVTDRATKVYPTPPETSTLWRPTVTENHAKEAVALLATTVSDGERLWKELDTDDRFHGAGGHLENAREELREGNYHEALFSANYGMQFAGEELGSARAKLGKADLQQLAERGYELLDRMQRVADDLGSYPTVDAPRDLAWYYQIEREMLFGRRHAAWDEMKKARDGVDDENGPDTSNYDPRAIGGITAGLLQAEIYATSAERYRDRLSEKVGGTGTPYADHLRNVSEQFRADIDAFPSRDEKVSTFINENDDPYSPYEFARSRISRSCYDDTYFGGDESEDLLVYRTVELSKVVAQRRAHGFAVDHLVVEKGDEDFDSGHTLAEKRRARSVYQSVVGSNPPPLLTIQVRRAVEDLQVAKVGFAGSYQRPLWRERLDAYLYALVGRAKLQKYPAVYEAVVNED